MKAKTIDFTSGVNPLGPSNKACNAIRSHVRHISSYDDQCLGRLKNYIARRERIEEACVAFGCGSSAIMGAILELIHPKKVRIPHPVSFRFSELLSRYGCESSECPLKWDDNFDLHMEDFCKAMEGCEAAILPNPHDLTGSVTSSEEILKIAEETERLGIYLILDESYGEYTGMTTISPPITASGKAVIVRTFSTFHALGGLRLGYVIGAPDVVKQIEGRIDPSWVNSFAQRAALASLKDKGYHKRTLLFVENEKAFIAKKLSDIQGLKSHVSPTNIMVIRLQKDRLDVEKAFKKHHLCVRLFSDEHGNTCIAFPVQSHRQNAYFIRILKRIMEA